MIRRQFKNILVISLSNIGDVVLSLPVVAVLKGNFKEASVSIVVGPKAKDLFYPSDYFKEIIFYDKKAPFPEQAQFLGRLRKKKFDLVIDLRNTLLPWLLFPAKASRPWGRRRKKEESIREKHLRVLDFLRLNKNLALPFPLFNSSHQTSLREKLPSFGIKVENLPNGIVLSPGARFWFKRWLPESYVALCRQMHQADPSALIFLTGSDEEKEENQKIVQALDFPVFNLSGKLSLGEFACLLSNTRFLISNDSAAMHFANHMKTRVIGIFGPTNPKKYGQESESSRLVYHAALSCRPCEQTACPTQRECLTELSVLQVYQTLQPWLESK